LVECPRTVALRIAGARFSQNVEMSLDAADPSVRATFRVELA
jgi:hypothetical protein